MFKPKHQAAISALLSVSLLSCASKPTVPFDGKSLAGWHADVRAEEGAPAPAASFGVEDGMLMSYGLPVGHLITDESYRDYRLTVEYRWPAKPGNCGVLVHCSTPRYLFDEFPKSIECQLLNGNAGDFWCIGETISVPNEAERRAESDPATWGGDAGQSRRILNLTDGSENEVGEWNTMVIECSGTSIDVWVNGDHVNSGHDCTASEGQIAIQAEGAPCQFRRIELEPLSGAASGYNPTP